MFHFYYIDFWSGEWDFTRAVSAAWPRPLLSNKPTPALRLDNIVSSPTQQDYG